MKKELKSGATNESKKTCRKKLFCGILIGLIIAAVCFVILDKAMVPLSSDSFCVSCHEMSQAHESWKQSTHHTNPSGVKVTCISCHLPPREHYVSHLTQKAYTGIKDLFVHYFGEYDLAAAREHVLKTLPNEWCLSCHSNLLAMPSSGPVETVHKEALDSGRDGGYGCVTCHDNLHGPKDPTPKPKEYEQAENYYCYVCHINFKEEEFANVHKNANVGCIDCHGDSDQHSADEAHIIPPDIMFKKEDINNSCFKDGCHVKEKIDALPSHSPFVSGKDKTNKYCTDCHGNHSIPERHRVWDKDTKKLIEADGEAYEGDINPGGGAEVYDSGMGM